jgi:co-chaperonin GroES (HSP10)
METIKPGTPLPITPLFSRIVVVRDLLSRKQGAIELPESMANKPLNTGTVVAVGEGYLCQHILADNRLVAEGHGEVGRGPVRCHIEPLRTKLGDRVVFAEYAGNEVEFKINPTDESGQRVLVMDESEIICRIEAQRVKPRSRPLNLAEYKLRSAGEGSEDPPESSGTVHGG